MFEVLDDLCIRTQCALNNDEGLGTVEIILILVVLIGLVILFKGKMNEIVAQIFGYITSGVNQFK